ncbi:MAG: MlaD family protein [Algiphilus sp.]|uniref:MlaD family protein n=1 Tax=Algiphilus sp. TaxID=1872431 RepID=UPI0032EECB07
MKSTSRSALAVGAFFVIGVVLIVSMISFFGSGLPWQSKLRAVAYFKGSLSGLTVGAPVTFRGVRVGNVERIELRIDGAQARAQIPVFLRLNPDAAQWRSGDGNGEPDIHALVSQGLRAQLASLSFVTGQLYIELDFHPDHVPEGSTAHIHDVPEIPTLPSDTAQVIDFVKQLPVRELVGSLRSTLERIDRLTETMEGELKPMSRGITNTLNTLNDTIPRVAADLERLQQDLGQASAKAGTAMEQVGTASERIGEEVALLAQELRATSEALQRSNRQVESLIAEDAPARADLERMLSDLARTARSLRAFSSTLEEDPNSLLFGK